MLKPGLGKGLGELMCGDDVAGKNGSAETAPRPAATFGRGLQTLVRRDPTPEESTPAKRALLPAWFYFAADVLLLAYTVALMMSAARPVDFGTLIFCAIATALGAILAVIGVVRSSG